MQKVMDFKRIDQFVLSSTLSDNFSLSPPPPNHTPHPLYIFSYFILTNFNPTTYHTIVINHWWRQTHALSETQ